MRQVKEMHSIGSSGDEDYSVRADWCRLRQSVLSQYVASGEQVLSHIEEIKFKAKHAHANNQQKERANMQGEGE